MSDSLQKSNNFQNGRDGFHLSPHNTSAAGNFASNPLDPQKILSLLFRYKWLVLFFLITGVTGAWFFADSLTPAYESTGTLMISPSEASRDDDLAQIISKTTGFNYNSTLINEIRILRSRKFAGQVARLLIEENPGGKEEFPTLWTETEEGEIYQADEETVTDRILKNITFTQAEEEADIVEFTYTSPSPQEAAKVVNVAMEIYKENSTRQNRQAAQSTAEFLEKEKSTLRNKLEASEEQLRQYMDSTGIVRVDEQATGLVAQRVDTEAELQRVNLELGTIQEAIANYEQQLERIKPGLSEQFSEAIGPRIRNSQEDLARFENERTLIIAKNPGVQEREVLPPRLRYVNEQIERLKTEIKDLSEQLFTEQDEFMGINSEDRAAILAGIQSRLVELRIEQNQYQSRRDALMQHKQEMDSSFNALPEEMIELAKLQRDVRINEELYLNVSRQHADMSVWSQSQFGFARIIDLGEIPEIPVSPNKRILLLVGLMLGGFIAACIIATREFMDNSVKSLDQVYTIGFPTITISEIPSFKRVQKKQKKGFEVGEGYIPDELVLLHDPKGIAAESLRRLKNNIIYQHADRPPKTIAVTSSEKGDGKTTIVANLGLAFAEEGYKTLLVDADFRRPKLHKYFGLTEEGGLTDYIYDNLSRQQLVKSTDAQFLKIVSAGKQLQKPEIVGNSAEFKQFLDNMKEIFDVIILDTPPFGIISDSVALLKNTNATLVVTRYRKTNAGMLYRTIDELQHIQANVTDIILNDFDHRKETSYFYGAGYYKALYNNYESYINVN